MQLDMPLEMPLEMPITSIQSEYTFVHFNTTQECDVHITNNHNLTVAYKCCDGKGFAVLRKNRICKKITICKEINQFIPIEGTCDICFLEETSLYKTCDTCSQPFCKPCLAKITNKVCPYCRGKLKNNF